MGRRWLLRVIAWDGLLPVVVWGVPLVVHRLVPTHRALMEFLGILLPIFALFLRYFVGSRQIAANRCRPAVQRLQVLALCTGIFVMVLIDAMMILSVEMPPGALFAARLDRIIWMVLCSFYMTMMLMAMYPGRDDSDSDGVQRHEVFP